MTRHHSGALTVLPKEQNTYIKRLIQSGENQQLDFKFETAFLPRKAAENILADLIYFGLIESVYEDHHFVYSLKRLTQRGLGVEINKIH